MTDHDELRRRAAAAREVAPGEWRGTISDDGCGEQHEIVDGDGETVVGLIWYDGPQLMMGDEIKAHIAAASPATVLALLDERDRLRELLERCEWSGADYLGKDACPICERGVWYYGKEHAPDCELAQALRGDG